MSSWFNGTIFTNTMPLMQRNQLPIAGDFSKEWLLAVPVVPDAALA